MEVSPTPTHRGQPTGLLTFDNGSGTFTYAPNADFYGTDSFTYELEDSDGDVSTSTVTITVDDVPMRLMTLFRPTRTHRSRPMFRKTTYRASMEPIRMAW